MSKHTRNLQGCNRCTHFVGREYDALYGGVVEALSEDVLQSLGELAKGGICSLESTRVSTLCRA